MKHEITMLLGLAVCFALAGCSDEGGVAGAPTTPNPAPSQAVEAAPTEDATAATVKPRVSIAADASPEDVVVAFLEAHDSETIGGLLTEAARRDTAREGFTPSSPAPHGTKYKVGNTEFASELGDRAQVACDWSETDATGYTEKFRVTWLLRKEKGVGWRIYGLATDGAPDHHTVFNFENAADMKKKLAAENGDSGVRQASLEEELPPNLND